LHFVIAQLHRIIPISFDGLDLRYITGPSLNNCHWNDSAALIKKLRHPDFFAENSSHITSWDCRLPEHGQRPHHPLLTYETILTLSMLRGYVSPGKQDVKV
jgi:hypothetical protein